MLQLAPINLISPLKPWLQPDEVHLRCELQFFRSFGTQQFAAAPLGSLVDTWPKGRMGNPLLNIGSQTQLIPKMNTVMVSETFRSQPRLFLMSFVRSYSCTGFTSRQGGEPVSIGCHVDVPCMFYDVSAVQVAGALVFPLVSRAYHICTCPYQISANMHGLS